MLNLNLFLSKILSIIYHETAGWESGNIQINKWRES